MEIQGGPQTAGVAAATVISAANADFSMDSSGNGSSLRRRSRPEGLKQLPAHALENFAPPGRPADRRPPGIERRRIEPEHRGARDAGRRRRNARQALVHPNAQRLLHALKQVPHRRRPFPPGRPKCPPPPPPPPPPHTQTPPPP